MKVVATFFNLFFLAGSILLLIFTVLSGSSKHFPLNKFYWLEADTSDITRAPADLSAWTFWGVCDQADYSNCLLGPAYPISPVDNFDTTRNVPKDFIDNENTYYYLSRFAFACCLIALGFAGLAFLIDILGFCFAIIDKVVIFLVTVALFFMAAFASFQTAVVVLAKNAFTDDDRHAKVGAKAMGIMWAAFVCLLICWFITFAANIANSYKKHAQRVRERKQQQQYEQGGNHPYDTNEKVGASARDDSSFVKSRDHEAGQALHDDTNTGGIRFFKIKRNQKQVDDESA